MTIETLYSMLQRKPQQFCIDNKRDTVLVARHGTLVYLRANSIMMPPGYVCDPCITVEIKEALFKSDIVRDNLTTISAKGEILVSQSMVSVRFKCDDSPLPLVEGADYVILAPTDSAVDAAGIFEGRWNDHDDHFSWDPASDAVISSFPAKRPQECPGDSTRDRVEQDNCSQCTFLFCGMRKWMGGWFDKEKRIKAKEHFACRKTYKKKQAEIRVQQTRMAASPVITSSGSQSAETSAAIETLYGKTNNDNRALRDSLQRLSFPPGFDTITDPCARLSALQKATGLPEPSVLKDMLQQSINNMKANGNPINLTDVDKLQFYAYNVNFAGWSNIDWMLKIPETELVPITVNLAPSDYTQCKLIFKNRRTVLPPQTDGDSYVFPLIPRNEPAWVLMINTRTGKGKIEAELRDVVTGNIVIDPAFRELTLEAFVQLLEGLNAK